MLTALSFAASALAQKGVPAQQSRGDPVRVTAFRNGVFQLSAGRVSSSIDLRAQLVGCSSGLYDGSDPGSQPSGGEADTRVIDLVKKGGAWHLTFQATLQGGCNVQGLCGAGTGTTLVWLKLTPSLKVAAKQAEVIETCVGNVVLDHYTGMKPGAETPYQTRLEVRGGLLEVVSVKPDDGDGGRIRMTVRYRHAFPEQGLKVSSKQVVRD